TATNGTASTFSANGYQFFGNGNSGVGNIIPFAEVNGGPATDFASYGSNGVTAFADYKNQAFSAAGNLTVATPSDIIRINATGTAAYTITAPANATLGAINFNNSASSVAITLSSNTTFTVASRAWVITGNNTQAGSILGGGSYVLPGPSGSFTGEAIIFQDKTGFANQLVGPVTGGGSVVINGLGTLAYNQGAGGNSYSGGTILNSPTNLFILSIMTSFASRPLTLTGP